MSRFRRDSGLHQTCHVLSEHGVTFSLVGGLKDLRGQENVHDFCSLYR